MLIWINGPFGGGKTQTAYELQRRCPDALVCDPEEIGHGLHRMTPRALRGDFQDFAAWRAGVVEVLDRVLRAQPAPVLAPMTVADPGYFAETVGLLRASGHDVRHFALLARPHTVRRRLRERGIGHALGWTLGRTKRLTDTFALQRLEAYLAALAAPEFAEHIHTDDLPISGVVDRIGAACGLPLHPDTDGPARSRLRRARVGLRHIRLR